MRVRLFAVVLLVITAGCMAPLATPENPPSADDRELGSINGYTPTDTIDIGDPAQLTKGELEALTYRTMARIEVIRGLSFTNDVEVDVYTREEIRERYQSNGDNASAFANELWRGAFIVDGETDVNTAFDRLYGDAVGGFYSNDRIVLVTDDPDGILIDRDTFVHELTHALQDQQFGLERQGTTLDERRAEQGLIEGEANYLPHVYAEYCEREADWECLPERSALGDEEDGASEEVADDDADDFNVGLFLSIFAPYSEGPLFIADLYDRDGWSAVDDAFGDRPTSTAQIIHPDRYPDDHPVDVDVEDRSSDGWEPMTDDDGDIETETVGEATLFAMLYANGALEHDLTAGASDLSPYNYTHPATTGWTGDTFVGYEHDDGETGHVWALEWQSSADAAEFADAYETLLVERGGEGVAALEDTYRIDTGDGFDGVYRVTVDGDRVEIVGAPDEAALESIHGDGTVDSVSPVGSGGFGPAVPAAT